MGFQVSSSRHTEGKKPSLPGKIFGSLFLCLFVAAGGFFLYVLIEPMSQIVSMSSWDKLTCRIISSSSEDVGGSYDVKLRYRYEVSGRSFEGSKLAPVTESYSSQADTFKIVSKYEANSEHSCFVNPENPQEAFLEKGEIWLLAVFLILPGIFLLIGLIGLYFQWFSKESKAKSSRAKSSKDNSKAGKAVFIIFALIGAGLSYPLLILPAMEMYASLNWPSADCEVLSSDVGYHPGDSDSGPTYSIDIVYRYYVDGKEYVGDRYRIFDGSSSGGKASKEAIVKEYPVGVPFNCFYDPADPERAVIKPGFHWTILIGLLPLIFLAIGLGGLWLGGKNKSGKSSSFSYQGRMEQALSTPASSFSSSGDVSMGAYDATEDEVSGRIELKPSVGRLGKFVGMLIFSLFWNGIVSVFLWQLIEEWQTGSPDWFLALFLTPFVLIGVGTIFGVFYFLLGIFNPQVEAAIEPAPLHLGSKVTLSWKTTGNVSRISSLKFTIEGKESARYRRGTSTYTDTSTFYSQVVKETAQVREVESGQVEIQLPENSMHSFAASNNKIIWELKIQGEIKFWPDVLEDFELTIKPKPLIEGSREDSVWV